MIQAKHLGHISLGVAVMGAAGLETALRTGLLSGVGYEVLTGGFEAGAVGALADWYAVTALFRHVPIPLLGRHSNIIIKNRDRLANNVADMVQDKLLTPDVITAHLGRFSLSDAILRHYEDPAHHHRLLEFLRDVLAKLLEKIEHPEIVNLLDEVLKKQLSQMDFAKPLGMWLKQSLNQPDAGSLWEPVFQSLSTSLSSPEVTRIVRNLVQKATSTCVKHTLDQIEQPKLRSFIAKALKDKLADLEITPLLGQWLATSVKRNDHQRLLEIGSLIVDKTLSSNDFRPVILQAIEEMKIEYFKTHYLLKVGQWFVEPEELARLFLAHAKQHSTKLRCEEGSDVRIAFNAAALTLADEMRNGNEETTEAVEDFKKKWLAHADLAAIVNAMLECARDTIVGELDNPNPELRLVDYDALTEVVVDALSGLMRDAKTRPDHPLRAQFNKLLLDFARRLSAGDPQMEPFVKQLRRGVIEHADTRGLVTAVLGQFQGTLTAQLADAKSPFSQDISRWFMGLLHEIGADPQAKAKLDSWLRNTVLELVAAHHDMIGDMVRSGLNKERLNDKELVALIEDRVGNDLQFIRLNGAVVGFLVGVILGVARVVALRA